jgi:uncharacterized protein YjbJ (UPF0337 family)
LESNFMVQDGIDDAARRVKGSIKEAIGKLTGDAKTEAEGAAEKARTATSAGKTGGKAVDPPRK